MRKRIVVAGGLLVFFAGWCLGAQQKVVSPPPGGNFWQGQTRTFHVGYLTGYIQGYMAGGAFGNLLAIERLAPEKMPPLSDGSKDELAMAHKVHAFLSSKDRTASDLEPMVSAFYGDYRNMPVCVADAILLSAASLAGNPATDQELNDARQLGPGFGCN